jgi:protein TonB
MMNKPNVMHIEADRGGQLLKGWGLSIALHGCLLLAVMTAMPKLTLTLEHESFRWDVALVEAPAPTPTVAPSPPARADRAVAKPRESTPSPARPSEPAVQRITRQVLEQEAPQPIRREAEAAKREVRLPQQEMQAVRRAVEPIQHSAQSVQRDLQPLQQQSDRHVQAEQRAEHVKSAEEIATQVKPTTEVAMTEMKKADAREIKQAERVVESLVRTESTREPIATAASDTVQSVPVAVEKRDAPAPVTDQAAVAEAREEPQVVARAPEKVGQSPMPITEERMPVQKADAVPLTEQPAPVSPPPPVPETTDAPPRSPVTATADDSPAPPAQEQVPVVARSTTPRPAPKADYGWLAETLHRRIVELRQYPSVARVNGWEGKVVLRVQIRQDGHLDSVSIVKSSGHETLDNAAMEAVRRACPLHMRHELTAPMVVVQVPINYSLNR